jgi:cytochrome c-type biogenesis protein CcmH/NrfG
MGLISGLLTLPVAPLRGTVWVAEQVLRQAEDSYYDPVAIRSQLEEVDRLRAEGAIDEDTATAWEDELVERLIAGQERTRRD